MSKLFGKFSYKILGFGDILDRPGMRKLILVNFFRIRCNPTSLTGIIILPPKP
jgi:hypothetical protein